MIKKRQIMRKEKMNYDEKKTFTIKDVKRSKEGERRMISGSERESVNK